MTCINDHIDLLDEARVDSLLATLPPWRRDIAHQYKPLAGRRECAVGYIELLRGLRLEFGIEGTPSFVYNEHGKPSLAEHPDIHFSISHCREAVGCTVGRRPCGLDIERIRKAKPQLVRRTMSKEEAEGIFTSPFPDIAFTRLWTQKEAVLKLIGTGITDDLQHVLRPEMLRGISLHTTENIWRGYIFTVATQA